MHDDGEAAGVWVNAADDQRLSLDVNVVAVQGADLLETQPRRGEEEQ